MRDWSEIDTVYSEILSETYHQPEDDGHKKFSQQFIDWLDLPKGGHVLDLGCGVGFIEEIFKKIGWTYHGITWNDKDLEVAQLAGRNVEKYDYNFLPLAFEGNFDLALSRHSLEHSPFPVITLRKWKKLAPFLAVVLPHPDWYKYGGKNHYSVMDEDEAEAIFDLGGWKIIKKNFHCIKGSPNEAYFNGFTKMEIWYLLERLI